MGIFGGQGGTGCCGKNWIMEISQWTRTAERDTI